MTANRAEQKEGGSMAGVTAEQRAALEAAGWCVLADDINGMYFHHPVMDLVFHTSKGEGWKRALRAQASLAAALDITPTGHVVVPIAAAASGWSLVEGVALQWAIRARGGEPNDASMAATWKAFGDALYTAIHR